MVGAPGWTEIWLLVVGLVAVGWPLVVVVRRRDPATWTIPAVGALLGTPTLSLVPTDGWHAGIALWGVFVAVWSILAGTTWALIATVTRSPPDLPSEEPPRPRGLSSVPGQLGLLGLATVVATVASSVDRGVFAPWSGSLSWLLGVPLALLAVRPGVRAARVRLAAGALLLGGALGLVGFVLTVEGLSAPEAWGPVGIAVQALIGGLGPSPDAWGRRRRRTYLLVAVGLATLGSGASSYARWWEFTRLERSAAAIEPGEVPVADPDPELPEELRRAQVGDGHFFPPRPDAPATWTIEVRVVGPDEPPPIPWGQPWVTWLGLTPDGDVRVATLALNRSDPYPWWLPTRSVVALRRSDDPARPYALRGLAPKTLAEARRALRDALCFPSVSIEPGDDWTAQELFDLCAEFGCTLERHDAPCWDDEHPATDAP